MFRARQHDAARIALSSCAALFLAFHTADVTAAVAGRAAEDSLVRVTSAAGGITVTAAHKRLADIAAGDVVDLPAHIETGGDGTLGLQQSQTHISIAPNSEIEIPAAASDGQLIARLVQWRGNVFYDVEQRGIEKLRVETPHLVAVVKGTQFNVATQGDTTTVSLFEGRLEIRTPDGGDVVEIEAGEIAIRSAQDAAVRVLRMDAAALPAASAVTADASAAPT
ncbi:MAG: FecR domain-containing protein, partial [Gammaproteobacteria bacterium]|nr:FecR domain-containing protein [Gammaproteobacteria bacterium]